MNSAAKQRNQDEIDVEKLSTPELLEALENRDVDLGGYLDKLRPAGDGE